MARRSNRNRRSTVDTMDESAYPNEIANLDELLRPIEDTETRRDTMVSRLDDFMTARLPFDGREFTFGQSEPYSIVSSGPLAGPLPSSVRFGDPDTTAVCVRRKQRKEVLFAFKKAGRGGGRRDRKRTWRSDIKC